MSVGQVRETNKGSPPSKKNGRTKPKGPRTRRGGQKLGKVSGTVITPPKIQLDKTDFVDIPLDIDQEQVQNLSAKLTNATVQDDEEVPPPMDIDEQEERMNDGSMKDDGKKDARMDDKEKNTVEERQEKIQQHHRSVLLL